MIAEANNIIDAMNMNTQLEVTGINNQHIIN